jgi:hypothetical protein
LSGVDYLKAFETLIALGAGFVQTHEQFSQVAAGAQAQRASLDKEFIITEVEIPEGGDDVMATWVGPELPDPNQPLNVEGWSRSSPQANYWNGDIQAWLRPHPIGEGHPRAHWDFAFRGSKQKWRIFLDGSMEMK